MEEDTQWEEIHPHANVGLINALHKAKKCEMILSKLYFTACFRREKWLWPSPVAMNVLEKFFSPEEMEMKIYNILTHQTSSITGRH